MDFLSLLEEHQEIQDLETSFARPLDKALTSERIGTDRPNARGNRSSRSFHRGPGRQFKEQSTFVRKRRWSISNLPSGKVSEEPDGTAIVYEGVHGHYDMWKNEWCAPGAHQDHSGQYVSNDDSGIVVFFEAKCENDLTFSLSPKKNTCTDPGMYEIVVGGWNDTKSIIRRHAQGEAVAALKHNNFKLCNNKEFTKFYACQVDDLIMVGFGDVVGRRCILSYNDPDKFVCKYVSFSGWDKTNVYKNITVDSPNDLSLDVNDIRLNLELEDFTKHEIQPIGVFSLYTDEERQKKKVRLERFQQGSSENMLDEVDNLKSHDKVEARAKRFNIPLKQDEESWQVITKVYSEMNSIKVPRKDLNTLDQPRTDALYIYGNFDKKYKNHIFEWFSDFGDAQSISIEWLHDCAINIVFESNYLRDKALFNVGKEFPTVTEYNLSDEDKEKTKLTKYLTSKNWLYSMKWDRVYLLRKSYVTDVKVTHEEFTTHGSFPGDNRKVKLNEAGDLEPEGGNSKRKREHMDVEEDAKSE